MPDHATCGCAHCIVRDLTMFSGLPPRLLALVDALIESKRYLRREVIFHQGDPSKAIYTIRSGGVKTSTALPDGREQILGISGPGDLLGFEALYEEAYAGTAEAVTDALVCGLPRGRFTELLAQHPEISLNFIRLLNKELERSRTQVRDLGVKDAKERVASLLLSLSPGKDAKTFSLALTRAEIAEMVGVAPETLIRILSEFKRRRLIQTRGHEITITSPSRLAALAG
jgi:CRP/FNR family transcriptional regulator